MAFGFYCSQSLLPLLFQKVTYIVLKTKEYPILFSASKLLKSIFEMGFMESKNIFWT